MPSTFADIPVVIGPHCELTLWVFDIVNSLAERAPGYSCVLLDRNDKRTPLLGERTIYLAHYPSLPLMDAIERGHAKVLLVADDPVAVCRYFAARLNLPVTECLRAQTATAVANRLIARSTAPEIIDHATTRTAGALATQISRTLGLPNNPEDIAAAVAKASGGLGLDASIEDVLNSRNPQVQAEIATGDATTVRYVIEPLLAMARGESVRPVVWPTEVFMLGDRPGEHAEALADVAGPARTIFYGPYLFLPAARYRVEAILAFSEDLHDLPFTLEVHGSRWLTRAKIERRQPGSYRGYFILDHREPLSTLEIRLRIEAGAQSGRLSLIELCFFPMSDLTVV
jgi:hypothetical protein